MQWCRPDRSNGLLCRICCHIPGRFFPFLKQNCNIIILAPQCIQNGKCISNQSLLCSLAGQPPRSLTCRWSLCSLHARKSETLWHRGVTQAQSSPTQLYSAWQVLCSGLGSLTQEAISDLKTLMSSETLLWHVSGLEGSCPSYFIFRSGLRWDCHFEILKLTFLWKNPVQSLQLQYYIAAV